MAGSLVRVVWTEAAKLAKEDRPKWMAPCKKFLASLYENSDPEPSNAQPVVFVRARAMQLPKEYVHKDATAKTHLTIVAGPFDYVSVPPREDATKWLDWHINFADKHLFGYYGGGLFAQDEMQTAEMPILASVRESLVRRVSDQRSSSGKDLLPEPLTRDANSGAPTPCIVRGAERRIQVAVDKNAAAGRPNGLYGNNFRMASNDAIKAATTVLPRGSQFVNIIAMDAPRGGSGTYTFGQLSEVLGTAYTGFTLAKNESRSAMDANGAPSGDELMTTIHTGHWGTGAYGGNKVVMAMLQILAARLAGVDKLVFHAFDTVDPVHEAVKVLENDIVKGEDTVSLGKILERIERKGYRWGVSDGN